MTSSNHEAAELLKAKLDNLDITLEQYLSRDHNFYVRAASYEAADESNINGDVTAETLQDQDLEVLHTHLIEALTSLSTHLAKTIPDVTTRPFSRMIRDVHAIQMGNKPKIFARPHTLPNGRAKVREVTWGRISLAATMEYAISNGEPQSRAAKRIATLIGCKPDLLRDLSKSYRNHPDELGHDVVQTIERTFCKMREEEQAKIAHATSICISLSEADILQIRQEIEAVMIDHYLTLEKGV